VPTEAALFHLACARFSGSSFKFCPKDALLSFELHRRQHGFLMALCFVLKLRYRSTHSAYLKVPKGDEMEEPPTEGLILRTEAAGRRYQKCRNDGKRYCDG
jgi:hypothetical protein